MKAYKNSVSYDGWLNEQKLVDTLTVIVGHLNGQLLPCGFRETAKKYKLGTQIKLPGSRSKYDFGFSYNNKKYLVEFDGNYQGVGHYNNAENCFKDDQKNELAISNGYEIIRVPFWLQLDNDTFELLFGFKANCKIENNFPHGFITNSSLNPASFCELGMVRFKNEFDILLEDIKFDILVSLRVKSDRLCIPIKYLWDNQLLRDVVDKPNYKKRYKEIKEFADEFNK